MNKTKNTLITFTDFNGVVREAVPFYESDIEPLSFTAPNGTVFVAVEPRPDPPPSCQHCAMLRLRRSCRPEDLFPHEPRCKIRAFAPNRFIWVVATPAPPDPNPL